MARPLEVLTDKHSTPLWAIGLPNFTRYVYLDAATQGTLVVPADSDLMIIDGSVPFFISIESFALDLTINGVEQGLSGEMNPSVRFVTPGMNIFVRTIGTGFVTASFWSQSIGETVPYSNP